MMLPAGHAARGKGACEASAILRLRTTAELSETLKLCHTVGQPVVAQGGKTGMVEGCIANSGELAVSLERMNRIEEIDTPCAGVPVLYPY